MDTYEQKYKEALAKCKAYIDDTQKRWSEEFCKATEEVFFEIFPELKEPEGEKIRKAQLDYWRSVGGKEWHGVPVQKVIAWLEKQGEKKEINPTLQEKERMDDAFTKMMLKPQVDGFDAELKESEDEEIRKELIEHIKANCDSDFILFQKFSPDDVIAWLEKQGEQKPKRVGTKKATGTLKEMLDNIDPIELEETRKEMLEVDGFDAELNALLKKYEYLPNDEMVECLKFYTAELINNKQRMEQ